MGAFLAELLLKVLIWILVLPALLVLATPIILLAALWGKGGYRQSVRRGYGRVVRLWGLLGEFGL